MTNQERVYVISDRNGDLLEAYSNEKPACNRYVGLLKKSIQENRVFVHTLAVMKLDAFLDLNENLGFNIFIKDDE